ncbi:hypothetical protein Rhopal_003824-T1 [Rhodotorula paludigena]|uniref:UBC core domain-containing protein n=1 Tax=Rhodotorula paludigena TaxID=86838 RepID=A0AAV5GMR7_9BASI|nr:hypothetical protein Rhopal_003824-T1 [Rhodotorula paludigena]
MPAQPARKRQKVSDPAPAPTADDAMADSDEHAFEYEDDHSDDDELADSPAMALDSDDGHDELDSDGGGVDVLVLSDSDSDALANAPPEPEAAAKPKGKLTARKQFALDVQDVAARYAGTQDDIVKNFKRDDGDEMIRFSLKHPKFPRGLKISLMFPELGGYPNGHEVMCFTEHEDVPEDVETVLPEVAQLPKDADRSLNGIVEFLIHRIVRGEPNPWADAAKDTDEDNYDYEDELDLVGANLSKDSELMKTLRSDFKQLLDSGYRPGFTRVSELDLVVSVSKKVNLLGLPARALQAWDSQLITGEVVYLVLLMNYGAKYPVDLDNQTSGQVRFKVGISPRYKPSRQAIASAFRAHSSNPYTKGDFEAISLSAPLDALLNNKLGEILYIRRSNDRVGWAGAEQHCFEAGKNDAAVDKKKARAADKAEKVVSEASASLLPTDPMASTKTASNFPLLAFSYLVRRFVMCPRFCLNCYKRCDETITALLIALGLGPSLEHEIITNAPAVDLLVQLAYIAAKEYGLKGDLLPVGLELKVPSYVNNSLGEPWKSGDPTVDFDTLATENEKCNGIAALISELPPIDAMRAWLTGEDMTEDERILNRTRKLPDMQQGGVSISAWRLLRWIVASNTSYLKQIEDEDELIQGISKDYRQFRLVVGSPAKEHLQAESVKAAQAKNDNAVKYPTLYAWHGSSVKNWHSMGLHYRDTINGRAYGHGVYFALDGSVSLGHYAAPSSTIWKNAEFGISKLAAICEVTNLPKGFVSSSPYLVVNQLDWINCRYLIVQRGTSYSWTSDDANAAKAKQGEVVKSKVKTIALDPTYPLTLNTTRLAITDVGDKLQKLENSLKDTPEELNDSDTELIKEPSLILAESQSSTAASGGGIRSRLRRGRSGVAAESSTSKSKGKSKADEPPAPASEPDTFEPADEARLALLKQIPPPTKPSRGALSMITKEIKAMLKTQQEVGPTKAGFYFDPERSNDNAFNWVIEIPRESFEDGLPLRKDLQKHDIKSILMEIRFGDTYPFSPPFFRVVHPRFLPFIHGGGGHVTGGGSICMDTSNLEPRPARLDSNWEQPYSMDEAIAGFRRAAATHNWQVPAELEQFALQG